MGAGKPKLEEQAAVIHDGVLKVFQRWSGLHRGKSAFIFSINGEKERHQVGSARQAKVWFQGAATAFGPHLAADSEIRDALSEFTGSRGRGCDGCEAVLPVGAPWCVACGRAQLAHPDSAD